MTKPSLQERLRARAANKETGTWTSSEPSETQVQAQSDRADNNVSAESARRLGSLPRDSGSSPGISSTDAMSISDTLFGSDTSIGSTSPGRDFAPGFRRPVTNSSDLNRIINLPRRPAYQYPSQAECEEFTKTIRRPGGTRTLRPLQVLTLKEALQVQGAVVNAGVGSGKTDITATLPEVMGSKVSVLMLPPSLKSKFLEIEYPYLATQYRLPNLCRCCAKSKTAPTVYTDTVGTLHVVSYSQLSTAKTADILDRVSPDLIILDEGHSVSDTNSSRTKRLRRYLKKNPACRVVVLSGTLTKRSIKNYAHLAGYALKDNSPLPHHYPTLEEWAQALDPSDFPSPPGALSRLQGPGDEDAHMGFMRRKIETPGWIATRSSRPDASLTIHERPLRLPDTVQKALQELRDTWSVPGVEVINDALTLSRYARQLSAGLFLKWVWPRQEPMELRLEWLEARKDYQKEVRDFLKHSSKDGMDSPLLLAQAAASGQWNSVFYPRWSQVSGKVKPETEAVWVDEFMALDAVEWGKSHAGIIWYVHADMGRKIAKLGGFPLYGPGTGEELQKESGKRTVVASVKANAEGWNLQMFRNQLVTTPSSSAKTWEQLLGRTHRSGQEADEVECYVYLHTPEMRDALKSAIENAKFIEKTDNLEQKLLYCTYSFGI